MYLILTILAISDHGIVCGIRGKDFVTRIQLLLLVLVNRVLTF